MTKLLVAGAIVLLVFAYLAMQTLTAEDAAAPAAGPTPRVLRLPPAVPAGQFALYGHIKTLSRTGDRFELRFDPALWLGGATGQRAAVDDGALQPGEPVPNDVYTRDETHRLLTFFVARNAHATVLTRGLRSLQVAIPEFAQILRGKNPRRRPLFADPAGFGFWIRVRTDTVQSLDEQYHP